MRNVKQDLANASGKVVSDIGGGRLAAMYAQNAAARRAYDRGNEGRTHDDRVVLEKLRAMVERGIEESDKKAVSGSLPVNSVFNALQIVNENKEINRDVGLKALKGHLEAKWKRDRTASISADDYNQIRETYTRNYPRSVVGSVIDEIGQQGYVTLPLSDLMHIASKIRTQGDFDRLMRRHGLHTNQLHHRKARNFILSVVNGR